MKQQVAGLEAEGLYGLIGEPYHIPPYPPSHPHPTNLATPHLPPSLRHPPQEPEEAVPEASAPVAEDVKQALEAAPPAASPALEVTIPTHMTPLCLQLGAVRGSISAGLRVAQRGHHPHMLLSAHKYAESI